jgi:hypothetical protein
VPGAHAASNQPHSKPVSTGNFTCPVGFHKISQCFFLLISVGFGSFCSPSFWKSIDVHFVLPGHFCVLFNIE